MQKVWYQEHIKVSVVSRNLNGIDHTTRPAFRPEIDHKPSRNVPELIKNGTVEKQANSGFVGPQQLPEYFPKIVWDHIPKPTERFWCHPSRNPFPETISACSQFLWRPDDRSWRPPKWPYSITISIFINYSTPLNNSRKKCGPVSIFSFQKHP